MFAESFFSNLLVIQTSDKVSRLNIHSLTLLSVVSIDTCINFYQNNIILSVVFCIFQIQP